MVKLSGFWTALYAFESNHGFCSYLLNYFLKIEIILSKVASLFAYLTYIILIRHAMLSFIISNFLLTREIFWGVVSHLKVEHHSWIGTYTQVYKPFKTPDRTPETLGWRVVFLLLSKLLRFNVLFYVHFLFINNALTCIFDNSTLLPSKSYMKDLLSHRWDLYSEMLWTV